jgi:hypothetical protein
MAAAYTISGHVADSEGEPLISASVRLLKAADSTVVKGVVSDNNGNFSLPNIPKGKYIVETSYIGYNSAYRNTTVAASNVAIGTITLHENAIALRETTVYGIKAPITVKEDTIEFNAEAYRTAPNAVVEDLLKRLPGVEVGSDGSITANGQTVSKILVDGKEFFSDDPTVASKNLPVDMVERLQVVNRKSDLARLTGVDDGEDETVINLTVKKGMQNGWFGTIEAGYGTDDRYKGAFNINRFWNGNQITFIGATNNVNDLSFTDGTASRFRRFGGTTGITTSQAFGVNFNVGNGDILRVGGDVMYSRSDRDTRTRSDRQYLFNDSTSYYNSGKRARDIGNNIRGDFRLQWKPDSSNTVDFRPNFSYNHSNSWSVDSTATFAGDALRSAVNQSQNRNSSRGDSWEFGGRLIYNHKFRNRPGRAFSMFADYKFSNVREKTDTYSWNKFFQANDSVDLYDQFANNHTWTNNVSARVSWTEPLGDASKGNFLVLAYRFQYRWNNADKLVYDHPVSFPEGWDGPTIIDPDLIFSESLSNRFRNDYMNQDIRLGYKHVARINTIDVGMSLVPQRSKSIDLINSARNIPERWVWNFAPYLRYRWKPSKTHSLNLDYMGRSSQPTMTQLQPVADVSNPLQIVVGNPELKPSFTHNVRLRFQNFNSEAQRSIMTMVDARVEQNSIVSKTTFDQTTGGQTTTYDNVNGIWNVRAMNMISFPFRNKAWTFNNHLMLYYSNTIGFNNGLRNRSGSFSANESFGIAWRPNNAEIELRPRYGIQTVNNSVQSASDRTVHSYGGMMTATYDMPCGVTLNTDLSYTATSGYSAGYDQNVWLWNASVGYSFLRGRNLTLTLRAYDLLKQNTDIRRTITANYIEDISTNSLGRYFMATVTYKFNTFGSGQQPRDRNMDNFGPDGPPSGGGPRGGRPSGPPPF